jgi:dTDP-4-dehydrorhamnose reductase
MGLGTKPGAGINIVADVTDAELLRNAIIPLAPEVIIHAAAYTDVDRAERNPIRAETINVDGNRNIAEIAHQVGAYLIGISSDLVFDGAGGAPYSEDADTNPLSVYGRTKLAGERVVLETAPSFAVVRTAWLYGGAGKHFPRTVLTVLRDRGMIEVIDDEAGSPTYAVDLAEALVALVSLRGSGIFHLVNEGRATRYEFAREVALAAEFPPELIRPTTTAEFLARFPLPAMRPADTPLANTRAATLGIRLRPWQEAVHDHVLLLAMRMGISLSADAWRKLGANPMNDAPSERFRRGA